MKNHTVSKNLKYYIKTIWLKFLGYYFHVISKFDSDYFQQIESTVSLRKSQNRPPKFLGNYYSYEFFYAPHDLGNHLHFENDFAFSRKDSNIEHCSFLFPSYYGLVCFNQFIKSGSEEYFNVSRKQLYYLIDHGTETKEGFFLFYTNKFGKFHLKGQWYAGITQAEMLSLALRINATVENEDTARIIHKLVNSLLLKKEEGGILINTPEGGIWIEEYPGDRPSYVLNGFIFCIIALLEYEIVYPSESIKNVNNELIQSLLQSLPFYKRGKYFKYSRLYPTLSNIEYQGVYVKQFKHLYLLTGIEAFKSLHEESDAVMDWKSFYEFYQINPKN